jgi:hypothetical protein
VGRAACQHNATDAASIVFSSGVNLKPCTLCLRERQSRRVTASGQFDGKRSNRGIEPAQAVRNGLGGSYWSLLQPVCLFSDRSVGGPQKSESW